MKAILLKYKPVNRNNNFLVNNIRKTLYKQVKDNRECIYIRSVSDAYSYYIDDDLISIAFNCAEKAKGVFMDYYRLFIQELSILENERIIQMFNLDNLAREIWLFDLDLRKGNYQFYRYSFTNNTSLLYRILSSTCLFVISMLVIFACTISGFSSPKIIVAYVSFSYIAPPIGITLCVLLACFSKYKYFTFCIYTYLYLLIATMIGIFIYSWGELLIIIDSEILEIRKWIVIWSIILLTLPSLYFYDNKHLKYCTEHADIDRYDKELIKIYRNITEKTKSEFMKQEKKELSEEEKKKKVIADAKFAAIAAVWKRLLEK